MYPSKDLTDFPRAYLNIKLNLAPDAIKKKKQFHTKFSRTPCSFINNKIAKMIFLSPHQMTFSFFSPSPTYNLMMMIFIFRSSFCDCVWRSSNGIIIFYSIATISKITQHHRNFKW